VAQPEAVMAVDENSRVVESFHDGSLARATSRTSDLRAVAAAAVTPRGSNAGPVAAGAARRP
jgi:hypothetical protein